MTDDDQEFVYALAERVPSLRPSLDEHIAYYDELLSHVFFGDVSSWAIGQCTRSSSSPGLISLLAFLEEGRGAGSPEINALIDQSFLENICGEEPLAATLPPVLQRRYRAICRTPVDAMNDKDG